MVAQLNLNFRYIIFYYKYAPTKDFLVTQMVKSLPAMQETRVLSLGWDDPLEKVMASHSSIIAWRIPWIEGSGRL